MQYSEKNTESLINQSLTSLPPHRALIRAKEAELFQSKELKPPVLDIGCGDGSFAKLAFKRQIDVGVDVLETDLEDARQSGAYQKVICAPAANLPFPDAGFQTIISNCVLEHIVDLDKALGEINRVLKPDGRAYFTVVGDNFNRWLLGTNLFGQIYTKFFNRISHHYHVHTRNNWKKRLEKTGLRVISEQSYFDQKTLRVFDLLHYLSVPCLLTRGLLRRWVVFPALHQRLYGRFFKSLLNRKVTDGAYYFFECRG